MQIVLQVCIRKSLTVLPQVWRLHCQETYPPPPLHIPSDMHCVVQDNIHTPRRATEIQRGGGVQISEGVGGGLLNRPLKFLTEGLRVAKIIVFIDDLLFAVRCTFFIACMIVYVTRLSSAHE